MMKSSFSDIYKIIRESKIPPQFCGWKHDKRLVLACVGSVALSITVNESLNQTETAI